MGFSKETMETYVEGVAQALLRAYNSLDVGTIRLSKDTFLGPQHVANINRSPTSYLLNPQDERELYADEGDTDKTMVQLEFSAVGREGRQKNNQNDQSTTNRSSNQLSESENQQTLIGILNWYAVHGTSMNSTNKLISGDNKGYASYLMEKHFNGQDTFPGRGDFVAAFASTNLGDASPNTAGPRCIDTGEPCDTASSTCNGMNAMCIASGPGSTMEESTEIIGRRQFDMAMHLLQDTLEENVNQGDYLISNVAFRHSFVDMSNRNVTLENGDVVRTCPAALGYGFAAGTTDGPGEFDFRQGQNTSNPFWNLIGGFLSPPSGEQKLCQHPKPILLNTGKVSLPYSWVSMLVAAHVLLPIGFSNRRLIFAVQTLCHLSIPSQIRIQRLFRYRFFASVDS
jgi:neutral ceramidase